ncbi:MAG: thioredoxin domain-containing protein [Pseudomonadota bacterium]
MATINLNKDNFREHYESAEILLVDFWAAWCGPCQNFLPIYEKLSDEYPDIVFGKVDTDVEQELAQHFFIRSIPTILVIREGYEVFLSPGSPSEDEMRQLIQKVKDLDMEEVRKKLDAEDADSEEN